MKSVKCAMEAANDSQNVGIAMEVDVAPYRHAMMAVVNSHPSLVVPVAWWWRVLHVRELENAKHATGTGISWQNVKVVTAHARQ